MLTGLGGLLQGGGHGDGRIQTRDERALQRVVQVGLAGPHGAVGVPGVLERASEQVFGGVDQRGLLLVGAAAAGGELGDQAGPFDAVAGRGAVRLELVVGLAAVELQVWMPWEGSGLPRSSSQVEPPFGAGKRCPKCSSSLLSASSRSWFSGEPKT